VLAIGEHEISGKPEKITSVPHCSFRFRTAVAHSTGLVPIERQLSHRATARAADRRSRVVTYSPAYTIVPTYECFNRCSYCNFRAEESAPLLELADADAIFRRLRALGDRAPIEILILSGEVHPNSPRRAAWFQRIYDLCALALDRGFLPHTNAGPLHRQEMAALKPVNASMGLMLEQVTPRLLETVHRRSPSKVPATRLAQLELAGELQIPFTTGLLLGLGETAAERIETLAAIASAHERWGHIQEVILQPHSPGQRQDERGTAFEIDRLPEVVAIARQILPDAIAIQIPPNLVNSDPDTPDRPEILLACLEAGARDFGGLSPRDEVNPDYSHPTPEHLAAIVEPHGWQIEPRLPVYPPFLADLNAAIAAAIAATHPPHHAVH